MPTSDEDDLRNARRLLAEETARKIAREEIRAHWLRIGVDVEDNDDMRLVVAQAEWIRRSYERSRTAGTRLLRLIGVGVTILTVLGGFIKFLIDNAVFFGGRQ